MLLNENPERDDELMESAENQESNANSPTQASQQDAEPKAPESQTQEAASDQQVETPPAEAQPETTTEPVAAETSDESPSDSPEVPAQPENQPAEPATEPETSSPEAETAEEFPAPVGYEQIISRIDTLISTQEPGAHILTDVSIPELIQLVNWMAHDQNLNQHVGRVGLVRHAFDALKAADSLNHSMETDFRAAFAAFNKQRSKQQQSRSGEREENAAKKRELINNLREITRKKNPELVSEVRDIQDSWKTIGQVPQNELEPLYREYRSLLDEFYELRSVHLELMEYDRKKNLEERERLIAIAKTLVPAEDDRENPDVWKEKLDLLQELQQEWKSAGHVPREDMDRINEAYRDAIDEFFEVRQGFREIEDKQREENAAKKEEILTNLETFRAYNGESPRAWNDTTQKVRELQEAWKQIGPGPSKVNGELWTRYKDVCNTFYNNKSAYFKGLDQQREDNLQLKTTIAEKAEAISTRTDWEAAAKELKGLQREWKATGPVPEKHSKKLWERFRSACDVFFEARRAHYAELHAVEKENLKYRKSLIEEVKKLQESEMAPGQIVNAVKEIQARWKESGRVPYKEKEKIWKEFRREIDAIFSGLDNRRGEARVERTVNRIENIDDDDERTRAIKGNIARVRKKIYAAQEKVDQYSTNIQFIARGKSGDKLRAQIQGEIDKEEKFIKELKKEIKTLDHLLKNPPKEEEKEVVKDSEEASPKVESTPAEASAADSNTTESAPASEEEAGDPATVEETVSEEPASSASEDNVEPAPEVPSSEEPDSEEEDKSTSAD